MPSLKGRFSHNATRPSGRIDTRRIRAEAPNVNRHLTFGHGIHHCLGSCIARLEAQKLLEGLLANFRRLEPAGEAPVRQRGGVH